MGVIKAANVVEEGETGQQQRIDRLRESLYLLQMEQPELLHALESARRESSGIIMHTMGFEHNEEVAIALLRCAHAFRVTLTFVPHRVETLADTLRKTKV